MSEFVSVALATYEGARFLQAQLDSYLSQTRLPDELVICDDGSFDETMDLVEEFKRNSPFTVRIYRNCENIGLTRNFERALSLCRGEIILFSDQDDYWFEGKMSKTLELFKEHPRAWLVCTDAEYADEDLKPSGKTLLNHVLRATRSPSRHIAGACTAINRKFAEFLLPFPALLCPQYDAYIHHWANVLECKVVSDEVLQYWRIHGAGATSGNEMRAASPTSLRARVVASLKSDAASAYRQKSLEFLEMTRVLAARQSLLAADLVLKIENRLQQRAIANEQRARVRESPWYTRWPLATCMFFTGHYRHFNGVRSFVRDLFPN